jgi:hypothetical protein
MPDGSTQKVDVSSKTPSQSELPPGSTAIGEPVLVTLPENQDGRSDAKSGSEQENGLGTGAIAGIIAGGVVALIAAVVIGFVMRRRGPARGKRAERESHFFSDFNMPRLSALKPPTAADQHSVQESRRDSTDPSVVSEQDLESGSEKTESTHPWDKNATMDGRAVSIINPTPTPTSTAEMLKPMPMSPLSVKSMDPWDKYMAGLNSRKSQRSTVFAGGKKSLLPSMLTGYRRQTGETFMTMDMSDTQSESPVRTSYGSFRSFFPANSSKNTLKK